LNILLLLVEGRAEELQVRAVLTMEVREAALVDIEHPQDTQFLLALRLQ
jgi:hypothetical protein